MPRASSRPRSGSFDAAEIISQNPATIQLRYLQTLLELGSGQSSTIVFPLPIDLIASLGRDERGSGDGEPAPAHRSRGCPTRPA